jgi:imidazolonepropionase-like amidohydrolase
MMPPAWKVMVRPAFLPLLLALVLQPAQLAAAPGIPPDKVVTQIRHVRVIDGTGNPPLEDATITIEGDKIASIAPSSSAAAKSPARVIDGTGETVMPGIINAHGHLALVDGTRNSADYYTREHVLHQLRQYERYGVTTMLSLGLNRDLVYGIRDDQQNNGLDGATVLVADRGNGVLNGAPPVPHAPDQLYLPTTPAEARTDVDEAVGRHTNFIKIWVDNLSGSLPQPVPKMDPEIARAIIEEAHAHHTPVAAHAFTLADAKWLVNAGVDVLAHSVRSDVIDDEFIHGMQQHGTYYIPTLTVENSAFVYAEHPAYMDTAFFRNAVPPAVFQLLNSPAYVQKIHADPLTARHRSDFANDQKNLKLAEDAGLKVAFGSDSGANPFRIPGFAEHNELALMVAAGLTPMQAIHAATGVNAQMLGIADRTGTLVAGHQADLILLAGNPLEDIHNTQRMVAIWHNGREIQPVVPAAPTH